jgi:primary-amine oxidase
LPTNKNQGSDGIGDDDRMYQCFLYMRDPQNPDEQDSNHYAFPLQISPVVSTTTMRVIRIDHLPTGRDKLTQKTKRYRPHAANEYIPESQELREDLKPLNIVQPEGVGFTATEHNGTSTVEWQKWSMRVGFNQREGMVLYDVSNHHLPWA